MRERKRPDWPITVHKYWIKPLEIPQELWDIAKLMQKTWNDMVTLREATQAQIAAIENISREEKRAIWANFETANKEIVENSGLRWECKGELLDRFKTACSSKQHPRHHSKLERIAIPHRFTGGGRAVNKIFTATSGSFGLEPVSEEAYASDRQANRKMRGTRGYFGLYETSFEFLINLHRELPANSFIKKVTLIGTNKHIFGWEWAVAFTIEHEPSRTQSVLPARKCGIDMGWRKFEDYIRLGVLIDNEGRAIEFKLPFNATTASTQRYNKKFISNPIIDDWRTLEEVQRKSDFLLEELKVVLRELKPDNLPAEIADKFSYLTKMRQGGIVHLLYKMQELEVAIECQHAILAWKEKSDALRRRINAARDRMLARRNWAYENIALWIAENYSDIAWEGDLGLKVMGEDAAKDNVNYALKHSGEHRHFAAIGELRSKLQLACKKTGANLVNCKAKDTSKLCAICKTPMDIGSPLFYRCANGHRLDNDVNAGINLLANIDEEFLESSALKKVYSGKFTEVSNLKPQITRFCQIVTE